MPLFIKASLQLHFKEENDEDYQMIVRASAPLRLGLGGGGTDLDAYSRIYGGCVVNVTIKRYAHCVIREKSQGGTSFYSADSGIKIRLEETEKYSLLPLHLAVHNRVSRDFCIVPPIDLETSCDVPPGSGLGSSSAILVAQILAYSKLLQISLSPGELARMAYEIEREELALSGGRQDQWASAYGGFNFWEFAPDRKVRVFPLLLEADFKKRLEEHLLLFYTGLPRQSQAVSKLQAKNAAEQKPQTLQSLHTLKAEAHHIREVLQRSDLGALAAALKRSWEAKKNLADGISNPRLEAVYSTAMQAGALAGKVVGAGGGGYMLFLVEPQNMDRVLDALESFAGKGSRISFSDRGAEAWTLSDPAEALWNPATTL